MTGPSLPYLHLTHLYPPYYTPDLCPKYTPLHGRYYHHRTSGIVSWELPDRDGYEMQRAKSKERAHAVYN